MQAEFIECPGVGRPIVSMLGVSRPSVDRPSVSRPSVRCVGLVGDA